MEFVFEDEGDEEEVLDLSDLQAPKKKDKKKGHKRSRLGVSNSTHSIPSKVNEEVNQANFLEFEDDIPVARSITDKDVQSKARRKRQTSTGNKSYAGRREAGWSLYCSHQNHLPNLCEREQDAGKVSCTCPCHEERGYVRQESEQLSGSDDEEIVFVFN